MKLIKQLLAFLFNKNSESESISLKESFITRVIDLLPNEPYCKNGYWSWAKGTIDLVFPVLQVTEKGTNKKWEVGLALHCVTPDDLPSASSLFQSCQVNGVPLLLLSLEQNLEDKEIIKRIEAVFEGQFSITKNI